MLHVTPSGGSLATPLRETVARLWADGGWVLLAIVVASSVAWVLLVLRWAQLRARRRTYALAGSALFEDGRRGRPSPAATELWVEGEVRRLHDGFGSLRALATLLPLLGLLGTVLGMLETFQVIQLGGGADPRPMADGIRQALLTTQAGILAALPVVLGLRFLSSRAERLANELELRSHVAIAVHVAEER